MGMPVVTVAAGGVAVVEVPNGMPVTEAANGIGIAVTKVVGKPYGMPVTFVSATGGSVVPPFTTWNPADKALTNLTNNNLTATGTATTSYVRAIAKKLPGAGKFYWEVTTPVWASGNTVHGFCPSALSNPSGVTSAGLSGVELGGAIYVNGSYTGTSLGTVGAGTVLGMALDTTGKLVWYRIAPAGNWNNSGAANPATGVGGFSVASMLSVDACPVAGLGLAGDSVVANFGASSFVGAVPSGFTAGWPA